MCAHARVRACLPAGAGAGEGGREVLRGQQRAAWAAVLGSQGAAGQSEGYWQV